MSYLCLSPVGKHPFLGRCRSCGPCKAYKQYQWETRAQAEANHAQRTIFITLSFRDRGTYQPEGKTVDDDLTKYLKRVRENIKSLRYLFALERGTRGTHRQHWHGLVHVRSDVRVSDLRSRWKQGYTHGRIAKRSDIKYVTKYTTKDGGRTRPSNSYGSLPYRDIVDDPTLQKAFAYFPNGKLKITPTGARGPLPRAQSRRIEGSIRSRIEHHPTTNDTCGCITCVERRRQAGNYECEPLSDEV